MKRLLSLVLAAALLLGCYPLLQAKAQDTAGSLADAVAAAASGSVVELQEDSDEDIVIDKDITIDLNGFSVYGTVTVSQGCTLTVKDSQTDDYTVEDEAGYGKLSSVSGTATAASGYLMISETDGISFHKVEMELTTVTLRPEAVGIYYTGSFKGDEVVAANVDAFGIALRLKSAPDAAYMKVTSACSRYYDFTAGSEGNSASGTLLKNVMRKGRADNKSNAQLKIYASPYIRTDDGNYHFGKSQNYSFMKVMQLADAQWEQLSKTQQDAMWKLYNSYESIIGSWYLPNMNGDTDIDIPI